MEHPDLSGYVVHWGTRSGDYSHSTDVGSNTSMVIDGLASGEPVFTVVTAYDINGSQSAYSAETAFVYSPTTSSDPAPEDGDDGDVGNGGGSDGGDSESETPSTGSKAKGKARFKWAAVDHPSVSGYTVHWGTTSGNYTSSADVGMTTEAELEEFEENVLYFAAITAHTPTGEHSPYSAELSFRFLGGAGGEVPAFRIGSLNVGSGGGVSFDVSGGSGTEIRIYASEDLESWEYLSSEPFTNGSISISDPDAIGAPKRFYRLEVH